MSEPVTLFAQMLGEVGQLEKDASEAVEKQVLSKRASFLIIDECIKALVKTNLEVMLQSASIRRAAENQAAVEMPVPRRIVEPN